MERSGPAKGLGVGDPTPPHPTPHPAAAEWVGQEVRPPCRCRCRCRCFLQRLLLGCRPPPPSSLSVSLPPVRAWPLPGINRRLHTAPSADSHQLRRSPVSEGTLPMPARSQHFPATHCGPNESGRADATLTRWSPSSSRRFPCRGQAPPPPRLASPPCCPRLPSFFGGGGVCSPVPKTSR